MTSMAESAMKGPELKGSDAENQNHRVVSVEGYDISLQPYYAKLLLEKHFSPCGKITDVLISRDLETGLLKSSASIFFDGQGADDKALELCGTFLESYLGVFKVVVVRENYLDYTDGDDDGDDDDGYDDDGGDDEEEMEEELEEEEMEEELEDEKEDEDDKEERGLFVLGFDVCAPELDIKIKLCEHFYSCGEVTNVIVCGHGRSDVVCFAHVFIRGQGATDKAQKLSDGGGGKIEVGFVFPTRAEQKQRILQRYRAGLGSIYLSTVVPPPEGFKKLPTPEQQRLLYSHPKEEE